MKLRKQSTYFESAHRYTLYQSKDDDAIVSIIRELYVNDILVLPTVVIETAHPHGMVLPSIYHHDANILYEGVHECERFLREIASDIFVHRSSHNKNKRVKYHSTYKVDGEGAPPTFRSNHGDALLNMFLKLDDTVELPSCSS